jgi:hypothetical protein
MFPAEYNYILVDYWTTLIQTEPVITGVSKHIVHCETWHVCHWFANPALVIGASLKFYTEVFSP